MNPQNLFKRVEETASPIHKSLKCDICFQPLTNWGSNYCTGCFEKSTESPMTPKQTDPMRMSASLSPVAVKSFLTRCTEDETAVSSPRFSRTSKLSPEVYQQSSNFENIPFLVQLHQKEYAPCNLCLQDTPRQLRYLNPGCRHSYCQNCLQELVATHPGLEVCYIQKCESPISLAEIDSFFTKCSNIGVTKVKALEDIAIRYKINFPKGLAENVDSYLDIGRQSTDVFFLMGMLLAQEKLSQKSSANLKEIQQFILSGFDCIPPEDFSQRSNTKLMRTTLQELFESVENFISEMIDSEEGRLDPNIKPIVADFILKECQKDSKFMQAVRWMGRCALCGFLARHEDSGYDVLFDKLIRNDWEKGTISEEECVGVFCGLVDSRITFVIATHNGCKERSFGTPEDTQEISVLKISSQQGFLGVLYNTI